MRDYDPFDDALYDLSGTVGLAPGQADRLQRLLAQEGAPQRLLTKAAKLAEETDKSHRALKELEQAIRQWQGQ